MYKIKLFNSISEQGLSLLNKKDFAAGADFDDYDGIMVRSAALQEVALPSSLLAIARAGAGVNNIPVDECSKKGIVVFNTPGANANAVKELVIAGLLIASRDIIGGIDWVNTLKGQQGVAKLVEKGKGGFTGPEIEGKTLGIIGLGAIGVMVANAAHSLGMDVYGFDPYISVKSAWGLSRHVMHAASAEEIYACCDYISIHVPLTAETKGMIDQKALSSAKQGVRILNFSRADLVNKDDMKAALDTGRVARYVTDFPDEQTLDFPNCICIPHLGASTPESEDNCAIMAARQLSDYLLHGSIKNSVNFPDVEMAPSGHLRICIIHENIPGMLSQISSFLGDKCINIENLLNKGKKDFAYTLIDVDDGVTDEIIDSIVKLSGVIRVRIIR